MREEDDIWLGLLARAAQAGDRSARDALWTVVGPRLMHIARRTAWDFPMLEPDDVAQETFPIFATLVMAWSGPDGRGGGFATYLFGMFRWRLYSLLRLYQRGPTPSDWTTRAEGTVVAPRAASISWHEYGVDFPAFVAGLPPHERAIFLLRLREGMATREVAGRLGLTPRTVSRYWNLTLRRLRAAVARRE